MNKSIKDILVIDDEQVILDSVVKIGGSEGFTVDSADNGQAALEKLEGNDYRLIVSDIMMPVMDGFALLDELSSRNISTPVIMTTGYSTFDNAVNSLYRGAIDFIPKPFSIEELVSAINRGIKYSGIIKQERAGGSSELLPYVPCPSKYFRIGYSCWVYSSGKNSAVIGITDLFNKTIDTITGIELVQPGDQINQANYAIKIETGSDLLHQVYSPISGKVVAVNDKLLEDFSILEKDPYFEGWIYQVEPADFDNEIKNLIPCCSDRV